VSAGFGLGHAVLNRIPFFIAEEWIGKKIKDGSKVLVIEPDFSVRHSEQPSKRASG
jgi:hypothetical protein